MRAFDLSRRLAAEAVGSAFLLATVVRSGIMAERLADGNLAITLLGNTLATGAILVVLIILFGPVSGAHFNPVVTLAFALRREISATDSWAYVMTQVVGGVLGVVAAHLMFEMSAITVSSTSRTGWDQWLSEAVATFGLVGTILGTLYWRASAVPYAVGLFISAAYWFTASTSFANPSVTVSRALTNTFSGIAPAHVPAFVIAQVLGALLAVRFFSWLLPRKDVPR